MGEVEEGALAESYLSDRTGKITSPTGREGPKIGATALSLGR